MWIECRRYARHSPGRHGDDLSSQEYACFYVQAQTSAIAYMWSSEDNLRCGPSPSILCDTGHIRGLSATCAKLNLQVSWGFSISASRVSTAALGLDTHTEAPILHRGSGDSNSVPHACTVAASLTKPCAHSETWLLTLR